MNICWKYSRREEYKELTIEERLERFMYRPNEKLVAKFVAGKKII